MRLIPLESKTARRQVRRLMTALDHEALEILRIARQLTDPYASPLHFERLRKRYGQTEIVKQFRRSFAGEHIDLAELSVLPKQVGKLSRQWHEQGWMILDRVEYLRVGVALYEHEVERLDALKKARGEARGRGRSIAWNYLVREQDHWGLSDEKVMTALLRVEFLFDNENNRLLLQDRIKKHRLRRGVKKRKAIKGQ